MQNSLFENNTAGGNGGAIYMAFHPLDINNVVFRNNSAINGGAIFSSYFLKGESFVVTTPGFNNLIFENNTAS